MGAFLRDLAERRATAEVVLLGVGLLSASMLMGCSPTPDATPAPSTEPSTGVLDVEARSSLVCIKPTFDLGEVLVKGRAVDFDHSFRVKNRSDKQVRIREVRPDCACVLAKDYSQTLEPGGETEIKVTVSVFGAPGKFRKTIVVKDESNGVLPLSIVGSRAISDLLYSSPEKVLFGTMTPGGSKSVQLVLSRYDGSPVNFRAVVAQNSRVRLNGEPKIVLRNDEILHKNCECVELPIRLDLESQPVGLFKSSFTIQTDSNDKNTAELKIDLEAMIVETETTWLPSIFVNRLERGESVERPLTRDGEVVDCSDIRCAYEGDESIQIDLVRSPVNGKPVFPLKIKIRRSPESAGGVLARGTLILRKAGSTGELVTRTKVAVFLAK